MGKNLRKHILSEYANIAKTKAKGPTMLTESIELSDPDEFILTSSTYLTHAIEESDPDEFQII